jgi:CHAT domain-containing protein
LAVLCPLEILENMIKSTIVIVIFLFFPCSFGQNNNIQEDRIYKAIDELAAHPNEENLQKINAIQLDFWKSAKPKSKAALLSIVILNCNKAFYENQLGKTNQAINSYEKAWQLFQKNKLDHYDIIEYCLKPLGNLYTITGDYDNAENTIKQYYFIAHHQSESFQHKTAAILNLSNVYQCSGRMDLATTLLEKTLTFEKLTNTQKGILLNNLGSNYIVNNNFGQAKKVLINSIGYLKKNKSDALSLSNSYRNLSTIYLREHDFTKANEFFELAKKIITVSNNKTPRILAKMALEEASLLFEQKKLQEASRALTQVFTILLPNYSSQKQKLPAQNSLYAETALLDALDLQASVYFEQNEYQKVSACYERSFYIEKLFQSMLVYENSKIINLVRIRNRTEKYIAICDLLSKKEKSNLYITKAFLCSEQSKAAVLKSYVNRKIPIQEKGIQEQIQYWNTIIVKEQQKDNLADISIINEAIKKQNQLMLSLKNIRKNNPLQKEVDLEMDKLYAQLDQNKATMISYFSGVRMWYSFTIQNKNIQLLTIENNSKSNAIINIFLNFFKNANAIENDPSGYNVAGNTLYNYLKLSVDHHHKNLIIIPDGILNFIPFEALITKKNATTSFAKMHYLLNDCTVSYNNSASFYFNSKWIKSGEETVLGVFPIFEKTNFELSFSKEEMDVIQKNFKGKYMAKSNATFDNFKNQVKGYSILHLSTHASSGDIIEPSSIRFFDQDVLYSELYNLDLKPNLVVLSACETGLGKLFKGEGAMSVARGFQVSGAQNLLFSLWKVNDYTTSKLMGHFYNNIHNGMSYHEANHEAKIQFLKDSEIPNIKKSPYYWAPFVYYGTLEKDNENKLWLWALGLLSFCIMGFIFWQKLKK